MEPQRPCILAVDDERRGLELLARTLRLEASITMAASAQEAWDLYGRGGFELVIADQRMPGMTGVDLLSRIAEHDEHVGRILLTGYSDLEATVQAINRGRVHAYLHKPCAPDELKLAVRSVLSRVRLVRENARLLGVIREQKESLEEALVKLRDASAVAVASERLAAIGKMTSMVAHDLRNPLSVVRAVASEMARQATSRDDPTLGQLSADLLQEAHHMERMCESLLDVARASESPKRRDPTPLDDAVGAALAPLRESVLRAGVRLDLDLTSGAMVMLDEHGLRRALSNLCRNALEAMPSGGDLRVRTWREDGHAGITVTDTGPGIPEAIRDRLFEPFVTSGKAGGSGLGLAIVRKFADDHGGVVSSGRAEDGGARFDLRLPLAAERP